MTVLGKAIKANRERQGLSLRALAEATGLSKNHVWDLETGKSKNPTVKTINDIATALEVPPGIMALWALSAFRRKAKR